MKDTINIHGKEYETVASRVKRFRDECKGLSIETELIFHDTDKVIIKATIKDGLQVRASGHAEEVRKASKINQTSAIENCETSAIGRALACFGYLGTEFASADEVVNAIAQQNGPSENHAQKNEKLVHDKASIMGDVISLIKNSGLDEATMATLRKKYTEVKTAEQAEKFKAEVEKMAAVKKTMADGFEDDDVPFGIANSKEELF